jgi:hypothetical protein
VCVQARLLLGRVSGPPVCPSSVRANELTSACREEVVQFRRQSELCKRMDHCKRAAAVTWDVRSELCAPHPPTPTWGIHSGSSPGSTGAHGPSSVLRLTISGVSGNSSTMACTGRATNDSSSGSRPRTSTNEYRSGRPHVYAMRIRGVLLDDYGASTHPGHGGEDLGRGLEGVPFPDLLHAVVFRCYARYTTYKIVRRNTSETKPSDDRFSVCLGRAALLCQRQRRDNRTTVVPRLALLPRCLPRTPTPSLTQDLMAHPPRRLTRARLIRGPCPGGMLLSHLGPADLGTRAEPRDIHCFTDRESSSALSCPVDRLTPLSAPPAGPPSCPVCPSRAYLQVLRQHLIGQDVVAAAA